MLFLGIAILGVLRIICSVVAFVCLIGVVHPFGPFGSRRPAAIALAVTVAIGLGARLAVSLMLPPSFKNTVNQMQQVVQQPKADPTRKKPSPWVKQGQH